MKIINLPKAKNYRDLGGVKTKDGRVVKSKMLLRGTPLLEKHAKDIEILKQEYNLKTIIDLRTKKEAEEKADVEIDGVNYMNMPILNETKVGISHEKKAHSIKSLVMMPVMERLYKDMVSEECLENLVRVLKEILMMDEDKFSVVFHCSAGKDRTGVLAALLLAFLGVDRKEILEDYLLTNLVTKPKANAIYWTLLIVKWNHHLAKKIKMYYIAKESFLESALQELEERFGSLDMFFNKTLQMTEEEMNIIREKFLC